jgi:hypothetical protein
MKERTSTSPAAALASVRQVALTARLHLADALEHVGDVATPLSDHLSHSSAPVSLGGKRVDGRTVGQWTGAHT